MNHEETVASMNALPEGITVQWSRVNQAWFVMWLGLVLGIKNTLPEIRDYLLDTYGVEWMPS